MTADKQHDRILALAGLMQAISLVQQLAETGQFKQAEFETIITSLLAVNAPSTEAVYGNIKQLKSGLQQLKHQLSKNKEKKDVQLLRYAINLLHLERQLAKRPEMMAIISREIEQIPQQVEYFGDINNPQVIARFADIYHRTISTLTPRVQVQGDPTFLQQADNVNRVRALLLAGIRAAILWRQKGGKRWHFIFKANNMLKITDSLLQSI